MVAQATKPQASNGDWLTRVDGNPSVCSVDVCFPKAEFLARNEMQALVRLLAADEGRTTYLMRAASADLWTEKARDFRQRV